MFMELVAYCGGTDPCVDMTSVLCDAGHPGEGGSGLSAQLAWALSTDGKPDGALGGDNLVGRCTIRCHAAWTIGAAWRRFPAGHTSQKACLIVPQREVAWMLLADLSHLPPFPDNKTLG